MDDGTRIVVDQLPNPMDIRGGQVWYGAFQATHIVGRKRTIYLLEDYVNTTDNAISIGNAFGIDGYSIGSCARGIVNRFIRKPKHCVSSIQQYRKIGYTFCEPTQSDHQIYYDIESCYYQLLCRMPTPNVVHMKGELFFGERDDDGDYRDMLKTIRSHKLLRNAIIGVLIGGNGERNQCVYHNGEPLHLTGAKGAQPAIGVAIARIAYELTALQREQSNSCYANTDSVIMSDGRPTVWADHGMYYRMESQGVADIRAVGNYKVGDKHTVLYPSKHCAPHRTDKVDYLFARNLLKWSVLSW